MLHLVQGMQCNIVPEEELDSPSEGHCLTSSHLPSDGKPVPTRSRARSRGREFLAALINQGMSEVNVLTVQARLIAGGSVNIDGVDFDLGVLARGMGLANVVDLEDEDGASSYGSLEHNLRRELFSGMSRRSTATMTVSRSSSLALALRIDGWTLHSNSLSLEYFFDFA